MKPEREAGELVASTLPLVYSIAKRFLDRGAEYCELVQCGSLALVEAARRFDGTRGVGFGTFAFRSVEGAMREFIRKNRAFAVPRRAAEKALELRCALEEATKSGRSVSVDEVGERLGLDRCEMKERLFTLEIMTEARSIDEAEARGEELIGGVQSAGMLGESEDARLDRLLVRQLIASLPQVEKEVIEGRYLREQTQRELAEKLGVSAAQIGRIEKRALEKLRQRHALRL